jgi:peptidoglycan hydrolase CwlO-like protein
MLKKLLIAVVAVAVGLTVVRSTKLGSLMRVKWNDATAWCNKQIPVETEIARLRDEISRLGNDTKSHCQVIAEEMVQVDNLKREISEGEAKLEKQKKKVTAMRDALNEGGNKLVVLGEEKYPRVRVEKQLARDFTHYKTAEAQLVQQRKLLESRETCLAKAREQLTAMQESRRDLEVEVSRLEAEYNTLKVAQTKSKFNLDDSSLSKVKEGVAALRNRIAAESNKAALAAEFSEGPISAGDTVKTKDLLKEIDQHFNKDEGKVAVK